MQENCTEIIFITKTFIEKIMKFDYFAILARLPAGYVLLLLFSLFLTAPLSDQLNYGVPDRSSPFFY